jgi:hypothetical protein
MVTPAVILAVILDVSAALLTQASSCHRARSTIAATDKPFAVIGLGSDDQPRADLAIGAQRTSQLIGQLPGDEHQGVDVMSRVVEHVYGDEPTGGLDRVGRTIVAAAGDAVSEFTQPPEPSQHVGHRQLGQLTQLTHAEPLQQFDEIVVETRHRCQQLHRQLRQEVGRGFHTTRHDHVTTACCRLPGSDGGCKPAVGNAHPKPAHRCQRRARPGGSACWPDPS